MIRKQIGATCIALGVWMVQGAPAQSPPARPGGWLQWGGPNRNFVVDGVRLADEWPRGGPPLVWSRPIGSGHSSILVDEGRLYTMYRPVSTESGRLWAEEEAVIAFDETTGRTLWEYRYPARSLDFRYGPGPFSTPLIVGDRLFTSGTNTQLFAFDKRTGKVLWSHDLVKEFGAQETVIRSPVKVGMSCSPVAYRDTVIVTAGGGRGQSVMAFDQATGAVVWKGGNFTLGQASPILIDFAGEPQLVVSGGMDINGMDPATGELLWSYPHNTYADMNVSTPLWSADNLLFVSSAYDNGSRMLRLLKVGGRTQAEERWFSRRLRLHFGTAARIGDFILGSSGDFGPAFLTALDVETGDLLWQDRSFPRASFLYVDGKLVILDEDGILWLARASRTGLALLARAPILTSRSWTVPTLVGSTLYARDRKTILKLELPTRP